MVALKSSEMMPSSRVRIWRAQSCWCSARTRGSSASASMRSSRSSTTDDPFSLVRLDGDAIASDPARLVDEVIIISLFAGAARPPARRQPQDRAGGRGRAGGAAAGLPRGDRGRRSAKRCAAARAGRTREECRRDSRYEDGERDIPRLIDDELRTAESDDRARRAPALAPLLGGDRRASRAELKKSRCTRRGRARGAGLCAGGRGACSRSRRQPGRCGLRGDLTGVEKEFAKARSRHQPVRDHRPAYGIRTAARLVARNRERASCRRSSGARNPDSFPPPGRFRQAAPRLDAGAPRARDVDARAESLDARKESDLGETIAYRALMLIARGAGRREGA